MMMKPEDLLEKLSLAPTQKCTVGCPILDRFFHGGLPCNSLTELVAESSSGKTQLCLQLLLSAQLPPLSASSLYIHTEFPFPSRRLHHLSTAFKASHPHLFSTEDDDPCDRIFVEPAHSAHHLLDVLHKVDSLLENPPPRFPVRLIVIDSIAAVFRSEFDNTASDMKRRASLFFKISSKLKSQASRFGLVVVVTNQVVDVMGSSSEGLNGMRVGNLSSLVSSGRRVSPALGLSWSNCVNSRIFLSRNEEVVGSGDVVDGDDSVRIRTRRKLHVVFAPHLPESSCEFVILREGIVGCEG